MTYKQENTPPKWVVTSDEIGHYSLGVAPDNHPDQAANHKMVRTEALWGNILQGTLK
jgi:hypothetical protein